MDKVLGPAAVPLGSVRMAGLLGITYKLEPRLSAYFAFQCECMEYLSASRRSFYRTSVEKYLSNDSELYQHALHSLLGTEY